MQLYAIPEYDVTRFDSGGVVMGYLPRVTDAPATVMHVARVAAGGTIGSHPAVQRQVFAVVAGEGEVAADDGVRRPVRPGVLVVWEPGEVHQTWATTDLVAVVVETDGTVDVERHGEPLP